MHTLSTETTARITVKALPGKSYPIGATHDAHGTNFCIFSKHCTGVELLLFTGPTDPAPSTVVKLDPVANKTGFYWHVYLEGVQVGQVYAFRVDGDNPPETGERFNREKVLLDPHALAVVNFENYDRVSAIGPGDNCAKALRGVVTDTAAYDWEGDVQLRLPNAESVIYELHVAGFTKHPSSGVSPEKRGTYAGLVEKIPYLKELGVTAVELMPIQQFDEFDARPGLRNYWGYSPLAFFAPHVNYSSNKDVFGPINEFRDMVKALHRAGIEVILDVVYNHTCEGNETGPSLSFKGFDNSTYYLLESDLEHYKNYSGCGNTLRANHPVVGRFILDSLRYWVSEMHVDGFRFDLASVLTRDHVGEPNDMPAVLWTVESDPVLAGTKLIAEAWDIGLYQVGLFINRSNWFGEWNGPFRDDVRRFVKGDKRTTKNLAARILGSSDIYTKPDREPNRSVQFITCHDGFTLNDLVTYDKKHNQSNGEFNADGSNDNQSWNCGVEGPTADERIDALRIRQIKNFLTILFTSQGTPMLLMGDEVRRTQQGNNNAYCQDNELSWFNWSLVETNKDMLKFTKKLITYTQSLEIFKERRLLVTAPESNEPHIVWHGVELLEPDLGDASHSLAFTLYHPDHKEELHIMLNAFWKALFFELPKPITGYKWHRIIDTYLPAGSDIRLPDEAPEVVHDYYQVQARSSVVLMALPAKQ
jgi:isoamylase